METKANLTERTLAALQDLIRINIDSAKGFREASDAIADANLARLFQDVARIRDRHAVELQQSVRINARSAADDGSALGTLHRWWLDLRAWVNDGDPYAVLAEVMRGEDAIKEAYERLLRDVAGNPLSPVLHRQFAEILATHDQMHQLHERRGKVAK
ncbi:MAG: PA2169 family four-helix-bundle protein [Planctomycetota bacterium]